MHNLFAFFLSFGLGVVAQFYWALPWPFLVGLTFLILIFLFYYHFSRAVPYLLAAIILFGFTLGVGRLWLTESLRDRELDQYLGQEITFQGHLIAPPDEREVFTRVVVRPEGWRVAIAFDLPRGDEWHYGDLVQVTGLLAPRARGASFTLDYELKSAEVEILPSQNFSFRRSLFWLKDQFLENLKQLYPEPAAGLVAGLLFGEKHALGEKWSEYFRAAGLSHIVVLSGYNLTLVATLILSFFAWCRVSLRPRLILGAIGIIAFTLMTGASAATVRAAMMALVALLARAAGREYAAGTALFLAGFLMLLYEPRLLVGDLGFQLSFLATFALIYFSPVMERVFGFWPKTRLALWREVAITTLAVQIFLVPWLLYKFGTVSLLGLPANILVLPLVPPVMLLGFGASLLGSISSLLAWPVMAISYPIIALMLWLAKLFATPTMATFEVTNFSVSTVIICYLFYFGIILWHNRKGWLLVGQ